METIQGTHKASKFAPQDFISNIPDNVVTNIMDRLPIQDAVRTGILSKNWRFKWTLLSQLVLDDKFFDYLFRRNIKDNLVRIISRILLHLRGAITKFVLSIYKSVLDAEDINHWILFLSRKGVKDLTLFYRDKTPLKLPTHLFSCLELTHLKLINCFSEFTPTFHGFPNLLSLELCLYYQSYDPEVLFIGCPLLEVLKLSYHKCIGGDLRLIGCIRGDLRLVEIPKLENLKILSLLPYDLHPKSNCFSTIFELLSYLPKLQELHLDFRGYKSTQVGAEKRFPTTFPCLKALKLSSLDLESHTMSSCFIEMVRSFPNLQTLEMKTGITSPTPICFPEIDYNTMGLLQLQNVVVEHWEASENVLCLIKYLLACSPILKKIVIGSKYSRLSSDEKLMYAKTLLKLYRASPVVDIDLL